MLTKGNQTKEYIIETSKSLFAQKGYGSVTMKDICEVCALSRGGLYRHFGSTKEIFIAMLDIDKKEVRDKLEQAFSKKISAEKLINEYFRQEKEAIFSEERGLYFAIHEFYFMEKDEKNYLDLRLKAAVDMLSVLFEYGQREKHFKAFNTEVMALHFIYLFDSLKTSSSALSISEKMVDDQIDLLKNIIEYVN